MGVVRDGRFNQFCGMRLKEDWLADTELGVIVSGFIYVNSDLACHK